MCTLSLRDLLSQSVVGYVDLATIRKLFCKLARTIDSDSLRVL
jgi:hypothetical protein